jgi:hypothetical protein
MGRFGRGLAAAVLASSLPASGADATAQGTPTEIVVTASSDASNGDVSSVSGLAANPGEDGISLREAIEATNNDPGTYSVGFDETLVGATITLGSDLPPLTGGGVTIDGDVGGDGTLDVTLRRDDLQFVRSCPGSEGGCGLHIASSGNRLLALVLEDFGVGVLIQPWTPPITLPTDITLANNVIGGIVMHGIEDAGVLAGSVYSSECGAPNPERCWSYTTWENTSITGNAIEAGATGIAFKVRNAGDIVEGATVTGNTIQMQGHDVGIGLQVTGDPLQAHISDVLIADNTIEGSVDIGIDVLSGGERAQGSTVEHIQILNNRVHLTGGANGTGGYCCRGITVQAGSDTASLTTLVDPPRYLDDNALRDVIVRGNALSGTLDAGVGVLAGYGSGGRRNRISNLRISLNTIRTSKPGIGVEIVTGDGDPYKDRYAADNRISDLTIKDNDVTIGTGPGFRDAGGGFGAGGVVIVGGHKFGRDNLLRDMRIAGNSVKTAYVGIRLIGGLGPTARRNRVVCVSLLGNDIDGTRKAVSVRSNVDGASGNVARLGRC